MTLSLDIDEEIRSKRQSILDLTPSLIPSKSQNVPRVYSSSITSITIKSDGVSLHLCFIIYSLIQIKRLYYILFRKWNNAALSETFTATLKPRSLNVMATLQLGKMQTTRPARNL